MKPVAIIAIAVGISVVSIFVISEVVWYFADQEFEKARDELKESLEEPFEKQQESILEQKEPIQEPEPTKTTSPECSGTAGCITGTVTSVIDGDTIKVDGQSIRFALVDAPKIKYDGGQSLNFVEQVCPVGSTVVVDQDDDQLEDKYGRMLGVVYCNDLNLNKELLDSGLGDLYSAFCDQSEFSTHSWAIKHGCTSSENETTNQQTQNCDSSYPDFCIPTFPPDLDCGDISQKRFTVLQPDPHRFDADKDGIGCES